MMRAIKAEFGKLKGARMLLWTTLAVVVYGLVGFAVAPVVSSPEFIEKVSSGGGVFARAAETGMYLPTWANYLKYAPAGIGGTWGLLLFGLTAAYLFGREFKEGTVQQMLSTPVRRENIVAAKMIVLAAWVTALALLSLLLQVVQLGILGYDGFSWGIMAEALRDTLLVTLLVYCTLPIIGWLAAVGKGYLWPMLFSVALFGMNNALVATDLAPWLPWTASVLVAGASWYPIPPADVTAGSWIVAVGVLVLGFAGLVWQFNRVETAA